MHKSQQHALLTMHKSQPHARLTMHKSQSHALLTMHKSQTHALHNMHTHNVCIHIVLLTHEFMCLSIATLQVITLSP